LSFQPDIFPLSDNAALSKALTHISLASRLHRYFWKSHIRSPLVGASGSKAAYQICTRQNRRFTSSIWERLTGLRTELSGDRPLHTDNPHAQPSTRASNIQTIPGLRNPTGVFASSPKSSSPWPHVKSLARNMSTDASSSARPKRQLVKAACQSCQKRKVKVRSSLNLTQCTSYSDHKASSAAVSDLCVCSVNKGANLVSTTPKQAYHESKLYGVEIRN
jgi:hypothetical protein